MMRTSWSWPAKAVPLVERPFMAELNDCWNGVVRVVCVALVVKARRNKLAKFIRILKCSF